MTTVTVERTVAGSPFNGKRCPNGIGHAGHFETMTFGFQERRLQSGKSSGAKK